MPQAVAAISQPGALLSIDWTGDLLGVECFASLSGAFVGNCKSPGGGLLLPHGTAVSSPSFGALFVDGKPSAELATGMTHRWLPHAVQRNATLWRPAGGITFNKQVRALDQVQSAVQQQQLSRELRCHRACG